MTARRSRRAPRAITAALATTAVALATAAPGVAQPAGEGAADGARVVAHRHSAAGDLRSEARTSSLAGTTGDNSGLDATPGGSTPTTVSAGDDGGVATLAVVLIAGGALALGGVAGVAGGRGLRHRAMT